MTTYFLNDGTTWPGIKKNGAGSFDASARLTSRSSSAANYCLSLKNPPK